MKINYIVLHILFGLIFNSCNGQNSYFVAQGVTDKTEQLKKNKTEWIKLNNNESINDYTRIGDSIFGGEIACNIKPLKGVDIQSFKVCAGTKYAKDDNNVYYPIEIFCIDYTDCGVCYFSKYIIEGANSLTFRYLTKDYATDGKNVYFRGKLMQHADGATFKVIQGPEFFYFATDKLNVYKHNEVFTGADPTTFYYDISNPINIEKEHKYIIADKNKKWEFIPPNSINEIKTNKY
jgi:hypothetical protein